MARIDIPDGDSSERRRLWQLNPDLGSRVSALGDAVSTATSLDLRVREVARMRIAEINGCPI
jgi:alkylhydroperoxidase family enzyme